MTNTAIVFPKSLWQLPGGRFTEAPIVHHGGQWELIDENIGMYRWVGKPFMREDHLFSINPSTGLWHMEDIEF